MLKYIRLNIQEEYKKEGEKNKKSFNFGLAVLKTILAFSVVMSHTFNRKTTKNKIILFLSNTILHVPSFFIMSFYFMSKNLYSSKLKVLFQRLNRLLIPYILWPIIIWFISRSLNLKYHNVVPFNFELLKLQLLWGCRYMSQFWFQWNLIAITIIIFITIFIFGKNSLFILHLLSLLSYALQYSGYSYKKFYLKYPDYKRFTLSRLFGMIPLSVIGLTIGFYKIINILEIYKSKTFIFSLSVYILIKKFNIFTILGGWTYYGIHINIQSICIIFIFSLFPSNSIKNKYIIKILVMITNYTAGVFYLHISIKSFFEYFLDDIKKGTFIGVIMNYIICYYICVLGFFFFGKTTIKYLFC